MIMNKKMISVFLAILFVIVIVGTICFFIFDIASSYNKEKISDDISAGAFGFYFRISLAVPIIVAETETLFDVLFFILNRIKKLQHKCILKIILIAISVAIIILAMNCYMGSINKNMQVVLFGLIGIYIFIKVIDVSAVRDSSPSYI